MREAMYILDLVDDRPPPLHQSSPLVHLRDQKR
jgi:hypothetical protein